MNKRQYKKEERKWSKETNKYMAKCLSEVFKEITEMTDQEFRHYMSVNKLWHRLRVSWLGACGHDGTEEVLWLLGDGLSEEQKVKAHLKLKKQHEKVQRIVAEDKEVLKCLQYSSLLQYAIEVQNCSLEEAEKKVKNTKLYGYLDRLWQLNIAELYKAYEIETEQEVYKAMLKYLGFEE